MVLDQAPEEADRPVEDLVTAVLACHGVLLTKGTLRSTAPAADKIGDSLAYDAALVRLCERVGVRHDLTTDLGDPGARRQAERRLASRLPSRLSTLARERPEGAGGRPSTSHVSSEAS